MATHSSILAWRIPWTEEPGELQSMRLQHQTQLKQLKRLARMHPVIQGRSDRLLTLGCGVGMEGNE